MPRHGEAEKELRCSFCNKARRDVAKLIAGPSVYICNECIDLCNDIIGDSKPTIVYAEAPEMDPEPPPGAAWVRVSDADGRVVEAREGHDGWLIATVATSKRPGPERWLAWLPHELPLYTPAALEEFVVRGDDGKALAVFYLREFGLEYVVAHPSIAAKRSEPGPDPDREPLRERLRPHLQAVDQAVVCSFCHKERGHVANMIAGVRVYICDECVALCHKIIAEAAAQ